MTRARRAHGVSEDGALIESFLDMMSAERGASANTLAAYRRDLLDFAEGCARRSRGLKSASREDVRKHLASLGAAAADRASALRSGKAPEFELPDVTGTMHRLSDHRGRKVALYSWASW